jgi:tRNA (guanine9-N1)-methyltransferase
MEGDERPQKMRKLSRDHEESQAEGVAMKIDSNAPENDNAAQPVTAVNTATQENANAETAPAPAVQSAATDGQNPPMSKNQLKKLRKKQEWEAGREERKVIRKEKVVAKRERKKEAKAKALEEGGSALSSFQ